MVKFLKIFMGNSININMDMQCMSSHSLSGRQIKSESRFSNRIPGLTSSSYLDLKIPLFSGKWFCGNVISAPIWNIETFSLLVSLLFANMAVVGINWIFHYLMYYLRYNFTSLEINSYLNVPREFAFFWWKK